MPKQKTHSGAKKKFKVTATGRLLRRHGMRSHYLEKKPQKKKRAFDKAEVVAENDVREVKRLLGGFRRNK